MYVMIDRLKKGQLVKSEVQLIKPDFILVSLKGHTSGRFAYLPAKRVSFYGSNQVPFTLQ